MDARRSQCGCSHLINKIPAGNEHPDNTASVIGALSTANSSGLAIHTAPGYWCHLSSCWQTYSSAGNIQGA